MDDAFAREIRPTLDLIDNLRSLGLSGEISLPQIVVMGDQSSGKSSVLQSISGIPFPRGSGLVTKCPIELIMKKSRSDDNFNWYADVSIRWGKDSSHKEQPKEAGSATDMSDLLSKIKALSDLLSSNGVNGFSHSSIVIKVSAPDAPDLTLIDLPGIVRTSTTGQDKSVIQQVNDLIESYIALPNTLILAVVPSNQDIATIDILERAVRHDPSGLRTIGVLTKPDLIGPGGEDEVLQVLLNIRKPLKLGYIMVKNISQLQLISQANGSSSQSAEEARKEEFEYFNNHEVFKDHLDKNLFGINNLVRVLSCVLATHIKRTLPAISQEIRDMLTETRSNLVPLNKVVASSRDSKSLLLRKLNEFTLYLRSASRGEYRDKLGIFLAHPELRLHSLIGQQLKTMQEAILSLRPQFNEAESQSLALLESEMHSQRGRELPGFLSSHVFSACIINLAELWRSNMEDSHGKITALTIHLSCQLAEVLMRDYPSLRNSVIRLAKVAVEETGVKLQDCLDNLLSREQDPFTTQDVLLEAVNSIRFRTFDTVLRQVIDSTDVKNLGENIFEIEEDIKLRLGNWYMRRHGVDSKGNHQEMITMVQAYWDIASRRFIDNVFMTVEKEFLSVLVQEMELQCTLFAATASASEVAELMKEDPTIVARKEELSSLEKSLEQASALIQDFITAAK